MAIEEQGTRSVSSTIIGSSIVIRGRLKSDEDLVVKGRVEAAITTTKSLYVEQSGIVKADVMVKSVRISGVLVGNIVAQERCEIAPDGRVVGDIWSPRIVIADGAAFKGRVDYEIPADKQMPVSDTQSSARPSISAPPPTVQPPPSDVTPPPEEKWQRPFVRPKRGGAGS